MRRENYIVVTVATLTAVVLVATVAVTVEAGAVVVKVKTGSGYLDEQKDCA